MSAAAPPKQRQNHQNHSRQVTFTLEYEQGDRVRVSEDAYPEWMRGREAVVDSFFARGDRHGETLAYGLTPVKRERCDPSLGLAYVRGEFLEAIDDD